MQKTALCRQASGDFSIVGGHRYQSRTIQTSAAEVQGDLESAAIRHLDIKEYDVRTKFFDRSFHFRAFIHKPDIHSLASQKDAQRHERIPSVIGNQYTHDLYSMAEGWVERSTLTKVDHSVAHSSGRIACHGRRLNNLTAYARNGDTPGSVATTSKAATCDFLRKQPINSKLRPKMTFNIKQTLLLRATKLLHGKDRLAVALNVPEPLLDAWMSGAVEMPDVKMPRLSAILTKGGDQTHGGFSNLAILFASRSAISTRAVTSFRGRARAI
jgi:hypothetical protein